jgi:hypothetical protein
MYISSEAKENKRDITQLEDSKVIEFYMMVVSLA